MYYFLLQQRKLEKQKVKTDAMNKTGVRRKLSKIEEDDVSKIIGMFK